MAGVLMMREARKIDELMYSLEIIAEDDEKTIDDLTEDEVVREAKFVLEKYKPGNGWKHSSDLLGENGLEAYADAEGTFKQLKQFITKYDKKKGK